MPKVEARDGVQIYVEAHGEGEPLLLSPGFCQTHENFRPQVAPLVAAGFRVILWDYRGHGLSDVPSETSAYSFEHVLDDLVRVLDWAAPNVPAVVGGLSFGGLLAQHFALRFPERVSALVLIASGPGFKNPESLRGWEAQMGRIADRLEAVGFEGYTQGRGAANVIGLRPDQEVAQAAGRAVEAQDPTGVARFGRLVAGPVPSTLERLHELSMPVLVLMGSLDMAYARAAQVMIAKLPKATPVEIAGAGHCMNLDEVEAFNEALIHFLQHR